MLICTVTLPGTPGMPERVSAGKYFRSLCTAHAGIVIFLHFCTGGITGLIDIIFHLLIVEMCCIFILLAVVWKRAVWCETFTPVERIMDRDKTAANTFFFIFLNSSFLFINNPAEAGRYRVSCAVCFRWLLIWFWSISMAVLL